MLVKPSPPPPVLHPASVKIAVINKTANPKNTPCLFFMVVSYAVLLPRQQNFYIIRISG
jgi:hypothetical protein